jgi:L-fuconolactonase
MDRAGVGGALLVSSWGIYGADASYAIAVRNAYPNRFAMVAPFDPYEPEVGDRIDEWAGTPGAVGIRLLAVQGFSADDLSVNDAVQAAGRHGLPICVFCPGQLSIMNALASRYPDVQFVADHLGLRQPQRPAPSLEAIAQLDDILALAPYANVAMKIIGACSWSRQPFPFSDIWGPLSQIFELFGIERCMWGTDWTHRGFSVDYDESVAAFRDTTSLSGRDRDALMGGNLTKIYDWSPI